MANLEELMARRDHLEKIRAEGIKSAKFADDFMEYKSDDELQSAINSINQQIRALTSKPVRMCRVMASKGA